MGGPKLLLPWADGSLIDQVLLAWTGSRVDETIVVVRKDDLALADACRRHRVRLVLPLAAPEDMKASIQCGLREIETAFGPDVQDRCFIAPADLPTLSSRIIDRLIATPSEASTIVVPQFGDKQGHPALLPWPMTAEIFDLGASDGVDRVVKRHPKTTVPFSADELVMDVDTPQEYKRLHDAAGGNKAWNEKGFQH